MPSAAGRFTWTGLIEIPLTVRQSFRFTGSTSASAWSMPEVDTEALVDLALVGVTSADGAAAGMRIRFDGGEELAMLDPATALIANPFAAAIPLPPGSWALATGALALLSRRGIPAGR